jgi:FkbM family methyltransferase
LGVVLAKKYVDRWGLLTGLLLYARLRRAGAGRQVAVRLADGRAVRVRAGTSDVDVLEQIFLNGEYDLGRFPHWQNARALANRIRRQGRKPLIVDAGANIGLATVFFAQLFPDAEIVAIEPDAGNFELLRANVAAFPSVSPVRAAVSDRAGEVRLMNPEAAPWAFRVSESEGDGESVKTVTMQEVLDQAAGVPFIVKVDIEGYERELFRSNLEWLGRTPILIIELHDWMLPWAGSSRSVTSSIAARHDVLLIGENLVLLDRELLLEQDEGKARPSPSSPRAKVLAES